MPSIAYSREDIVTSTSLVELVADAIKTAAKTHLDCGKSGLPDSPYLNVFPGEHYRLINAIAKVSKAKKVVEIGTYTGMGTLALKAGSPEISVVTYDVIKWDCSLPRQVDSPMGDISAVLGCCQF
jgi:predicted O-methyltransferase YrrM